MVVASACSQQNGGALLHLWPLLRGFNVPVGVLCLQQTADKTATYHVLIRCHCLWASGIHPGSRSHVSGGGGHKWVWTQCVIIIFSFLFKNVAHADLMARRQKGMKVLTTVSPRWKWASCMLLMYSCPLDWIKNSHLRMRDFLFDSTASLVHIVM